MANFGPSTALKTPGELRSHDRKWWKEAVVYQIYPASYKDSNEDGIGDLPGIITKLDYVRDLGADVIWISPHFTSPQVDMGYDISDYNGVHAPYGTLEDCDRLINEIHIRGMRVIFDLVINHTSDQHPWFKESKSSKNNPRRDWYIWRPAKYDDDGIRQPPNNWKSYMEISAWTWDEDTEEYYLHLFCREQPDLNWENKDCREGIYESAIMYWLNKGVDGFRIDTVNIYSKSYQYNPVTDTYDLPDAPTVKAEEKYQFGPAMFCNGPRMREFLSEINEILEPYEVMTVGELQFTHDPTEVMKYISAREKQLNMVFTFEAVQLGQSPGGIFNRTEFSCADFKRELTKWQNIPDNSDAWNTVFLENHDHARSISRFASDKPEHRVHSGKMLAMILATMTGTLFLYQGQEIGMINAPRSWSSEEYRDVLSVNYYANVCKSTQNNPRALSEAMDSMQLMARDHARVPMQWDGSPNGGFCSPAVRPWMKVIDEFKEINVEDQAAQPNSVLNFWKKMLALRKEYLEYFIYGKFHAIKGHMDLMVFTKENSVGNKSLTVANLSGESRTWVMPESFAQGKTRILVRNRGGGDDSVLQPYEGRVYIPL